MRERHRAAARVFADAMQQWPAERRGRVMFVLWLNALVAVALEGAEAGLLATSAARAWRRRANGTRVALAEGPHWRALAAVALLQAGHLVARGLILSRIRREMVPQ